jgi:hypothetical protein
MEGVGANLGGGEFFSPRSSLSPSIPFPLSLRPASSLPPLQAAFTAACSLREPAGCACLLPAAAGSLGRNSRALLFRSRCYPGLLSPL